jgi:diguanylate cyclase (GGDEF)-like protein
MTVELVSAFAGDREMTETEGDLIHARMADRGNVFFSDLLYVITHHYFPPEVAERLWQRVLAHKHLISERLGRNVRITVAALDYLSNITSELAAPTLIAESYVSEIASLSMRDGMTGLFNHSTFYELLELELKNHQRYGVGVSIILMDVDDFKAVNDRRGHQGGDRVLVEVAKVLVEQTRESDICCRFGGDEFVVILRLTNDPREACEIAERIRLGTSHLTCGGASITTSAGVATCDSATTSSRQLVEQADRALRQAKASGRNRVVFRRAR